MIKFSIIVPVYNVQAYLARCVESLVNQNYSKEQLQVILVDDGSTDNSGSLCDSLAADHGFIQVCHKANGGLSDARNYGIDQATGEYVVFLDSDDYLSSDALSKLAEAIVAQPVKPDVVAAGMVKHIGDKKIQLTRATSGSIMTGATFLEKELSSGKFLVAACGFIYKKSFLVKNELYFWKGILHEDEDFTPRVLLMASTVLSIDEAFYHYVIREDSITTKKDRTRNAICLFEISRKLTPVFDDLQNSNLKKLLKTHLAKIMYRTICDAELFRKEKRLIIDYTLLKQNSVFFSEKIRYYVTRISPKLLHMITALRRY